uniref:hypothetical protein n=1 Tax=Sporichthya sp. TaxID=65475 RepID=UPI00185C25A5|nr:hypothetical protein [Sporichthya sp.]
AQPPPVYSSAGGNTAAMASHGAPRGGGARPWLIVLGVLALIGAGGVGWALSQESDDAPGTQIPFGGTPTPTPTVSPLASASASPSSTATVGPPPSPNPLATPIPTPTPTPTPVPIIVLPTPTPTPTPVPVPTAELNGLQQAIEAAAYTDPAAKDDLAARMSAIRSDAENNKRPAAAAKVDDLVAKIGELEGQGVINPEDAQQLKDRAAALRAKLVS